MNKKQLIYLFVGVIGLLIIFVIFLAFQQATPSTTPKITASVTPGQGAVDQTNTGGSQANGSTGTGSKTPPNTPIPRQLNADDTVKAFYYSVATGNPLANGGYKTNSYLAPDFKDVIHDLYKNGNTVLFCPQNKRSAVVVGQDQQVYSGGEYLTEVIISEAPPGSQQLYRVLLQNAQDQWYIYDVNCIH